ncbi:hypothetical protein BOX15_Mlig004395g1 [Macrostomum lignano]|uniref:Translin-associated factor X-interacting protein 1 N-terminal domain-containing protein n=1 Tax=Macrostomum lignano TaxID=282301 RepID=A0A267ELI3_9PLAT|nr:hypothetical protein BOX15_Mlig004395g1 [Macrostomum lignano]
MSIVAEISVRDKEFVADLRKQIQLDFSNIEELTKAREYEIYKEAFDKIISYVTSYRPLLTAIKAEYEEVVDSIVRGHREAQSLEMKVESIAAVVPNLQNYKKRCDELESRINSLKAQEQQAQARINALREARLQARERHRQELEAREAARKAKPPLRRRLPPGMTLDEVTDAASLAAEKTRVDRQLRQLRHKAETQYVSRERTDQLRQSLLEKIKRKEELEASLQVERLRQQIVRLASRAAEEFEEGRSPPGYSLAGTILLAARQNWANVRCRPAAGGELADKVPDSNADVTGADPARQAEADNAAECLDRFRELLAAGDLPAAASHAANSFRGLLRTMDVLQKFRHLEARCPGLLLAYCEALLVTVPLYEGRLGAELSFECVAEALARDRVDLVEHWTTNDLLTLTEPIGDLLADHGDCRPGQAHRSFELAHVVFDRTAATAADAGSASGVRAVECLVRAGRAEAAVAYGVATVGLDAGQFRQLLQRQPSVELALHLVGYGCLTVGDAIGCFFAMEAWVELGWLADSLIQRVAEESGLMTQQAALKLMEDNAEVPASVWTEIARQAPEDMRHLNELFTSSVVFDAFNRSLSTMQREFSLH